MSARELRQVNATAQRLKALRLQRGFKSVGAAASALRLNRNTLKHLENGTRQLTLKNAPTYAAAYGVPVEWLLHGATGGQPGAVGTDAPAYRLVPILRAVDLVALGGQFLPPMLDANHKVAPLLLGTSAGPRTFAFEMADDSMSPAIPKGAVIFFDPEHPPGPGAVLLALIGDDAVVRRYHFKDRTTGAYSLEPENAAFDSLHGPSEQLTICGVMRAFWVAAA